MLQPPRQANTTLNPTTSDPIAPLRMALRGKYEIERELGQGAFATVYLARDLKHERKVAIKVLNADPTSETGELRFIREIRMLARLQHPNILPLHDSGHVEALLYYVMPYVRGETLRTRIDRQRQLVLEDALCIAQEAADALAYAHGQGIVHRDIKPENILLSEKHAIVADFGIARAIDVAGIRQLTRTGVGSPGTPAYMAPEQLLGEREVDARCDIYSLGCVLYEMLTGKIPFAGKEGFVKRFTEAPPKPSSLRATVPSWIDGVIARTLARNPNERFANAGELASALILGLARERATPPSRKIVETTARQPAVDEGRLVNTGVDADIEIHGDTRRERSVTAKSSKTSRSKRHIAVVATVVLALALIAAFSVRPFGLSARFGAAPLDSTRFAVVPFAAGDKRSVSVAAHAADKLYEAFRAWDGLNLVPDLKVDEALGDPNRTPSSLAEAINVARKVGAAQLVWGHVVHSGDTSLVPRAELYDLRNPSNTVRELVLGGDDASGYAQVAAALLAPRDRPAAAIAAEGLTHNYAAWTAYNRGHIALAKWNLVQADSEFARAIENDKAFPAARLWLAQVREWRDPASPQAWREHADRAAAAATHLLARDSLLALALRAMASKDYPTACANYRQLVQRDANDFVGWYGLGECQGLDGAVVRDIASPSGWRWRSSYHSAVQAFTKALALEPAAYSLLSYQRLQRLLPTSSTRLRVDDRAAPHFAAFPSLSADTLAFVPYPISRITSALPVDAYGSLNQALSRNVDVLYALTTDWVRAIPSDPNAFEALADVLETRGDIYDKSDNGITVMIAIQTAARTSSDPQQRLRLAVRGARILFKRGDFGGVSRAADSLFAASDVADNNDPPFVIGLAALTGHMRAFAQQAQRVLVPRSVGGVSLTPGLSKAAGDLFAASSLGVCGEPLASLRRALDLEAQNSLPDLQRSQTLAFLTARPLSFMVPCTNGESARDISATSSRLYLLQKAYAKKSLAEVGEKFREIAQARRAWRPGEVSLDYTYQEAWIRAQVADTVAATAQLDRALNGLPLMSGVGIIDPAAAAAAGRAMMLRAELATKQGDTKTARHWAAAVADLWKNADPELQPAVRKMARLAATGVLQ